MLLRLRMTGVLASAWSPKAVLAGGVAIWSVAQILSPDAAHFSLPLLVRIPPAQRME
jgi:hypothetical protein